MVRFTWHMALPLWVRYSVEGGLAAILLKNWVGKSRFTALPAVWPERSRQLRSAKRLDFEPSSPSMQEPWPPASHSATASPFAVDSGR